MDKPHIVVHGLVMGPVKLLQKSLAVASLDTCSGQCILEYARCKEATIHYMRKYHVQMTKLIASNILTRL